MLCLCPTLRDWWSRGYFALRCLDVAGATGVDDTVVHLQLHWLPRQTQPLAHPGIVPSQAQAQGEGGEACVRRWEQSPRYGTEPAVSNEAGNTTHGADDEIVAMMSPATSRLLRTGDIFTVTMPSPGDRVKMKAMLDVQWACLRFTSMSGAAGEPRFVAEGDDHTMS